MNKEEQRATAERVYNAAVDGNATSIQLLLEELPLHVACRTLAPIPVLRFLVDQDPSTLQVPDDTGSLPIHTACRAGAPVVTLQFLVEKGGAETVCVRDYKTLRGAAVSGGDQVPDSFPASQIRPVDRNAQWGFACHGSCQVVGFRKCHS